MGLATAHLLASRSATLSLADISEQAVQSAAPSLPGTDRHIWTTVDVRSTESVDKWIAKTAQRLGKIDGVVNMAGIIRPACHIVEETDESFSATVSVNTMGVFRCLRAQLKAMGPGGSIVGLSSPSRLPNS